MCVLFYIVICGLSGCAKFFCIISKSGLIFWKKLVNMCFFNSSTIFVATFLILRMITKIFSKVFICLHVE